VKKENVYKVVSISLLILPLIVFAQTANIRDTVLTIAWYLGMAAIAIGAVFVALGIYKVATSAGDPRGLSEGMHYIVWGIIAILLGALLQTAGTWLTTFGISW